MAHIDVLGYQQFFQSITQAIEKEIVTVDQDSIWRWKQFYFMICESLDCMKSMMFYDFEG